MYSSFKTFVKRYYLPILFFVFGSFILLFVIGALLNIVLQQFLFNSEDLWQALTSSTVLSSIMLTLYSSFLSTLIAVIFGTPLAYVLARYNFPGKGLVESIIDLPVIIPHSVAGIALYVLLMRHGLVGSFFSNFGVVFEDSLWGIVAAMFFVSFPFYLNSAREGFQSVNPHLEYVARTLGAGPLTTFYKISVPLALRHLFSGALMSWARGISEFGAVIMIAFYPMVAPVLIYYKFNTAGVRGSQPIAVLLTFICFILFVGLRFLVSCWRRNS